MGPKDAFTSGESATREPLANYARCLCSYALYANAARRFTTEPVNGTVDAIIEREFTIQASHEH
jgi:hypothetical protein